MEKKEYKYLPRGSKIIQQVPGWGRVVQKLAHLFEPGTKLFFGCHARFDFFTRKTPKRCTYITSIQDRSDGEQLMKRPMFYCLLMNMSDNINRYDLVGVY